MICRDSTVKGHRFFKNLICGYGDLALRRQKDATDSQLVSYYDEG